MSQGNEPCEKPVLVASFAHARTGRRAAHGAHPPVQVAARRSQVTPLGRGWKTWGSAEGLPTSQDDQQRSGTVYHPVSPCPYPLPPARRLAAGARARQALTVLRRMRFALPPVFGRDRPPEPVTAPDAPDAEFEASAAAAAAAPAPGGALRARAHCRRSPARRARCRIRSARCPRRRGARRRRHAARAPIRRSRRSR